MITITRRLHYAWIIAVVTFVTLIVAAGVRTLPTVLIKPLEGEFGWNRGVISLSVMFSLFAYGLGGVFAGTFFNRYGPRRVMFVGLAMTAVGVLLMLGMTALWQWNILWGLVVGVGTGIVANVIAVIVSDRWFAKRRGVVLGILGAAGAMGQTMFLPLTVALNTSLGWRGMLTVVVGAVAVMTIPVLLFMRSRPADVGTLRYGEDESPVHAAQKVGMDIPPIPTEAETPRFTVAQAVRTRDFWLLAGSFFVCGYTTNGLIGTHLLPHALEHGFAQDVAAGALGLMGLMNVVGTLASGWLSDRYDNRVLLACYYLFRTVTLLLLPFIPNANGVLLTIFTITYGIDWIATVPPTVNLTAQRFGRASLGAIYGWIFCAHMIGAGIAAWAGGALRASLGNYTLVFFSAAALAVVAAALTLRITPRRTAAVTV